MDDIKIGMKERAAAQLDTQKLRATDSVSALAGAVRHSGNHLRAEQHEVIAQYVDKAADQLERFAATVRNKDAGDLLRDARQLARRQPALFVGGSFAVGLLAARFLKSSQRDTYDTDEQQSPGPTVYSNMAEATRSAAYGSATPRDADYADRGGASGVESWSRDANGIDRGRF